MAFSTLHFGDQKTADVKLYITFSDGRVCKPTPLFLHSQVITQSAYFQEMLSDSSFSNWQALCIKVRLPSTAVRYYWKCLRFMYYSYSGKPACFYNDEEAVNILEVCWEWRFHDGIRASLQFFAYYVLPRYISKHGGGAHERENLDTLQNFLHIILEKQDNTFLQDEIMDVTKAYFLSIFEENASSHFMDFWRRYVLKLCEYAIEGIGNNDSSQDFRNNCCDLLLWVLDLIKVVDGKMLEATLQMFSENVCVLLKRRDNVRGYSLLLDIIVDRFMKAVVYEEISITRSERLSFLANWIPILMCLNVRYRAECKTMGYDPDKSYAHRFEKQMHDLLRNLPPHEKEKIFRVWSETPVDEHDSAAIRLFEMWSVPNYILFENE